ncbi:sulfotransferase domain-containing protein [Fluviibacterium sp. DFM31]|uniref:Sulfotransferase domain-containing protein n=1 Tax=Meridianimarinicoccus marinus TaxID=3231483 RepID=A0ABV3L4X0_9RHOB
MTPPSLPRYQGSLFDSARWAEVELRPGDVVLSTPPKCGTTWTLAMIYLALHGPEVRFNRLSSVAPWVDFHGGDPDAPTRNAQPANGRRLFKTHTPLDGLPLAEGVAFVTVYRDPGESFLSMRRHLANMTVPPPGHPNRGALKSAFDAFVSLPSNRVRFDGVTLSSVIHHLRCSEARAALRLHYAAMSHDPLAALRAIAEFIGITLAPDSQQSIVETTRKDVMRRRAEHFAPEANTGLFKDDARFFSSREQFSEHLVDTQREMLLQRARIELGAKPAAWLCQTEQAL